MFSTCSFVVFASAAVVHGVIVHFEKIDILFYVKSSQVKLSFFTRSHLTCEEIENT